MEANSVVTNATHQNLCGQSGNDEANAESGLSKAERRISQRGLDTPKWNSIRKLVRDMAYRVFGERYGDADDCASEFSGAYCKEPRLEKWPFSALTEVWLKVEAAHFINNFAHRIKRMRNREIELDEMEMAVKYMVRSPLPGPEQLVVLSTTAERVIAAIGKLTLIQRTVVFELCIRKRTAKDLAEELRVAAHLVSARLWDAKQTLIKILKDEGLTEDAIDELRNELHRG